MQDWSVNLELPLDSDQAAAVGAVEGDVRWSRAPGAARPGRSCREPTSCSGMRTSPRSLLLAFNRKAAEEMRNRLREALGDLDLPHVLTFHALAT